MSYIDKTPDLKTKLELIDTLRTVTEGKVWDEAIFDFIKCSFT